MNGIFVIRSARASATEGYQKSDKRMYSQRNVHIRRDCESKVCISANINRSMPTFMLHAQRLHCNALLTLVVSTAVQPDIAQWTFLRQVTLSLFDYDIISTPKLTVAPQITLRVALACFQASKVWSDSPRVFVLGRNWVQRSLCDSLL